MNTKGILFEIRVLLTRSPDQESALRTRQGSVDLMKAKELSAIYLAAALMVGPWHLHAESQQPLLVAYGGSAAADDASLYADGYACHQRESVARRGEFVRSRGANARRARRGRALLEGLCGEQGRAVGECAEHMRRVTKELSEEPVARMSVARWRSRSAARAATPCRRRPSPTRI